MRRLSLGIVVLLVTATVARAQVPGTAVHDGGREADTARVATRPIPGDAAACATGTISYIFIDNHSIFDTTDPALSSRFSWAYHWANRLHRRTRKPVIRRELLFHEGDCYDPVLLAESARLLRGYDFISQADIYGILQPDGTYHVIVDTNDDWSTTVDLRLALENGLQLHGARVREANLIGSGISVSAFYIEHDVTRDYGATYETPQLAATRWDLRASAGHTRAGTFVQQTLAYPFVSDYGRWATRESFDREDRLFDYIEAHDSTDRHVLLPVRDKSFDLAVVGRLGRLGNLTLFGGGLSFQERSYGRADLVVDGDYDHRSPADSAAVGRLLPQLGPLDNVRAVLLLGQRNIWWVQRRALDALRGRQDIRLGAEVSLSLARALPQFGQDNDLYARFNLYGAFEVGDVLLATRMRGEGRRNIGSEAGATEWADVYGEGEAFAYWRPPALATQTFVARVAADGGWATTTPFQLTLGGDKAVRGFAPDRFPGGRRLVLSGEDRIFFGWPFPQVFDLGGTAFADVGHIWPGDAPFGIDSGWRGSIGAGLRAAFPAGSRTTYRADIAVPLGEGIRRARLILSIGEILGVSTRFENPQVLRSRQAGVSGDLFTFPR